MMRLLALTLPLLLAACGGATTYQKECSDSYEQFAQVFNCTKNKLYNDPRAGTKGTPSYTTELVAYGEYLNSQLRQQLITNAQAKQMFAQKTAELEKRYEAPSLSQPVGK